MSNKLRITSFTPCLLTFMTEAKWLQRVSIVGTGLNLKNQIGKGRRAIHFQQFTGPGSWTVEAWYQPPGTRIWKPSTGRVFQRGREIIAGFDDGADHKDFDDATVSLMPTLFDPRRPPDDDIVHGPLIASASCNMELL